MDARMIMMWFSFWQINFY